MRTKLLIVIACTLAAQVLMGGCAAAGNASNDGGGGLAGRADSSNGGSDAEGGRPSGGAGQSNTAGTESDAGASVGGTENGDAGAAGALEQPCATRVSYGDALDTAKHAASTDDFEGLVTWDGVCTDDGASSFALLSNGTKRYFTGHGQCVLALDTTCPQAGSCSSRITYGPQWQHGTNHAAQFDKVGGRVFWDGACQNSGANSLATLSNGWAPHFTGNDACALSFSYTQCGGLYDNPVIGGGCADPGVMRDGSTYVLSCTSGGAPNAFPIYTSKDLAKWTKVGAIFPTGTKPKWTSGDFWAPEIHRVGDHYVAYFTARHTDGKLSIGAATAASALGPFTDLGQPLIHDAAMGMIDANQFEAADGTPYLVWKADGNASGKPTPIYGQRLSVDGTVLLGARTELITNDLTWEGGVVEGPWVVQHGAQYFLFYSGNSYANETYAVGVARAKSPLGPYEKAGPPIVKTNASWIGPGHNSVVETPAGESVMVYHAWPPAHTGRVTLIDAVRWGADWPSLPEAPSISSRPLP